MDFGVAYYRDELKAVGINPEITIQQRAQENRINPYWTQETDKIKKFLGIKTRTEYTTSGKINFTT